LRAARRGSRCGGEGDAKPMFLDPRAAARFTPRRRPVPAAPSEAAITPFRSVRRGRPASHPQEDSPFRSIRSAILRGCVPADLKGGAIGSPEPGMPPEKRAGVVPEPIRDGRHAAGRLVGGENAAGLPGPLSGGGRASRAWAGARDGRSFARGFGCQVRAAQGRDRSAGPRRLLVPEPFGRLRRRQERSAWSALREKPSRGISRT